MDTSSTLAGRPSFAALPPPEGRKGWPWTVEDQTVPHGTVWPRITIVTPSYNQAQYLEEALRSVLLQGYPNLEYIVMDGGSNDGSRELIERYAPWLSYWQSQRDGGQSAAIADGFARASGEILAWINSDDRLQPGALLRVAHFFKANPKVVFANGDANLIDAEGRIYKRVYAIRPLPVVTANLGLHSWPQQGCFWRRDAYEQVGGVDRTLQFCMDRDLFLRLTRFGPSRRIPGPPLGDFRIHEDAKTSRWVDIHNREDKLLRERYGSPRFEQPVFSRALALYWRFEQAKQGLRRRTSKIGMEI